MKVQELIDCNVTKNCDTYYYNGDRLNKEELVPYFKVDVLYFEVCGEVVQLNTYEVVKYSLHIYTASL